jgi:hypothetical protein
MNDPLEKREEFGFLNCDHSIVFNGGAIHPLPGYATAAEWIEDATNLDGFIYPPTSLTKRRVDNGGSEGMEATWQPVPKTERPAFIHQLPMSHLLTIEKPPIGGDLRRNDGAFLLHLLAYLFGSRLHFKGWGVDGRIPTKKTHQIVPTPASEVGFIAHAYDTWKGWDEAERRWMINILYMTSRSPCHEWDWERFTINYMVFDAIYKLSTSVAGVPKGVSHGERYSAMRTTFGLADDRTTFKMIKELRNDLFHEALWAGTRPGEGGVSEAAWLSVEYLRRINQRLIPAVLGFQTPYSSVSCTVSDGCTF